MENNNKDINVPKKEFLKTYINFSLVLKDPLYIFINITRFVKQWTYSKTLFQTKLLQNPDSERGQMMIKLITNLKKRISNHYHGESYKRKDEPRINFSFLEEQTVILLYYYKKTPLLVRLISYHEYWDIFPLNDTFYHLEYRRIGGGQSYS